MNAPLLARHVLRAAAVIAVLAGTDARADRRASAQHNALAVAAYDSGEFARAVAEFQRAYDEFPAPQYLNNIAQSYRRLGQCADALDYFERFLATDAGAARRDQLAPQLAELRALCEPSLVSAPPAADPTPQVAVAAISTSAVAPDEPHAWSLDGELGAASLGAGPVVMPPVARARVIARWATRIDRVHVGIGVALAPLPYGEMSTHVAWLVGPVAVIDDSWPITRRVSVFAEAGFGLQLALGLGAGNPFTLDGASTGAVALPYISTGAGIAWRVSERTTVRLVPLAYEAALHRSPLATDIEALRGLEVLAGVAYDL